MRLRLLPTLLFRRPSLDMSYAFTGWDGPLLTQDDVLLTLVTAPDPEPPDPPRPMALRPAALALAA